MKLETSDCWQNEENFKALLMVTKIFNLSLWKVEKMSNENRATIFQKEILGIGELTGVEPRAVALLRFA